MRFYGQFEPPVDQFIYERYFLGSKTPHFFVECGAFDGETESSCKFFEETLGWEGINIEPSPPIFQSLQKNRPNSVNINFALSNINEKHSFDQAIHPEFGEMCTNGSLAHLPDHKKLLVDIGCTFKSYEVQTITWRDMIKQQQVQSVELLVLDVEGNELQVIEGMEGATVLPSIICVEHSHIGGTEILEQKLRKFGYEYDTSSHVNSFFVRKYNLNRLFYFIKNAF